MAATEAKSEETKVAISELEAIATVAMDVEAQCTCLENMKFVRNEICYILTVSGKHPKHTHTRLAGRQKLAKHALGTVRSFKKVRYARSQQQM